MFDIGWTEMLIIAVIAIVVVGPKDLPRMLRTVGNYVGKAKRMAREFQTQFDDAIKDSELDDVRKSFNDLKSANPSGEVGKALSPLMQAADDLKQTVEDSDKDDDPKTDTGNDDDNSIAGESVTAAIPSKPSAVSAPETKTEAEPPEAAAKSGEVVPEISVADPAEPDVLAEQDQKAAAANA